MGGFEGGHSPRAVQKVKNCFMLDNRADHLQNWVQCKNIQVTRLQQ